MLRALLPFAICCSINTTLCGQLTLLDPAFGANGIVLLGLSGFGGDDAEDLALQADGRIVVVGKRGWTEDEMAVIRLLENGSLDPGFSGDGKAWVNIGANAEAKAVAIQTDGAIVVAGSAEFAGGDFDDLAFARLLPGGGLDMTFSGDGKFTVPGPGAADVVLALQLQPDGRILAAGKFDGTSSDMVALRLTTDGALDPTFGDDGIFNSDLQTGEVAEDLVLRADGRIVLAGGWRLTLPDADLAMLQLTEAGVPDPTFGTDGLFRPSEALSTSLVVSALELQDDRMLIVGKRYLPGGNSEEVFTGRVLPDGSWDTTYGSGGRSFLPLGAGYTGVVRDMVLLQDDKALVTVDVLDGGGDASIMVLRVLPDGGLDTGFGTAGRVVMPCPGMGCTVRSISLDGQQRVLAVGSYLSMVGSEVMVMRWLPEASSVGQPELAGSGALSVFPMPASDRLFVEMHGQVPGQGHFELFDVSGRMVMRWPMRASGTVELVLPATVGNGHYTLRSVGADRTGSAPVIVQR